MTTEPLQKIFSDTLAALQMKKQPPVKTLKRAYLCGVMVLAALTVSSHLVLKKQIHDNASNVRIINTSGQLKTATQRIALLGRNLVSTSALTERENLRKEILIEVVRMETSLRGLMAGDERIGLPKRHSDEVNDIFFRAPVYLHHKMQKFVAEARALAEARETELSQRNPHLMYLKKEASGDKFIADIEILVRQYQAESERGLEGLRDLALFIMAGQLLILFCMAVLLFRPLIERVGQQIEALNLANDVLEQRAEQRELKLRESERLALIDPLTEVLNRRGAEQVLSRESKNGSADGVHWTVLLIDLDDFKTINDRHGHAVGDQVLREVARVLKGSIRHKDLVCRVGGDEFLVILPQTSTSFAVSFAEKIRLGIERAEVFTAGFDRVGVSASLGLAAFTAHDVSLEQLLRATHAALHKSKDSGKNRVSYEISARPATP
ncbi:MAG TPA: GGDEF domain-containing protein [Candidatus Eisenbacteria bacterium]|nr:GGDEF domain-containing protein [Candidatus Eisenbacteria bacterium]